MARLLTPAHLLPTRRRSAAHIYTTGFPLEASSTEADQDKEQLRFDMYEYDLGPRYAAPPPLLSKELKEPVRLCLALPCCFSPCFGGLAHSSSAPQSPAGSQAPMFGGPAIDWGRL